VRWVRVAAVGAFVAIAGTSGIARAQADAAAEPPGVLPLTAPEPLATPLGYPAGASGVASVVLELTVDVNGDVSDVRALEGEAPFTDAAIAAARQWRFRAAARGGRSVASRIRFSLRFTPPEPEPKAEATPGAAEPGLPEQRPSAERAAPPVVRTEAPVEVLISGQRRRPGAVTVTREEARALPGSFGDPLRSIEAQPGVVPIVSGLPAFFIRGAPPANVGFFLDGVDMPLLYHAFLGPSVIHPGLIESIDFYPGAAPVEYGRFAGPVVAAHTRPFQGRLSGEGNLRLIDVGGLVEVPVGECASPAESGCSNGGFRVAGRYSYAGLVLSLLSDVELAYWDYQGQARIALGPRDDVSVLAFGGYDSFRAQQADNSGGRLSFHRLDTRWDHRFDRRTALRVGVTGGYDRAAGAVENSSLVSDRSLRVRGELESRVSDATVLRAGIDGRLDHFGLETNPLFLSYPDYSTLFPERTETVSGAYLSVEVEAARGVRVAPGVRADVYRSLGVTAVGVDPRISAEFDVTRSFRLEHSLGVAHQRPNFAAQVPGAQIADLEGGLQWALLWSSGVHYRLPWDLSARATVFRTAYFRALDPIGGGRDFTIDRTVLDRRSTVSAAGLELQLFRPLTEKLGGFVSYTLSRSEQSTGNRENLSGFDRPHVLQAALSYDFGRGFRAGTRAVFYSGIPELNLEGSPHFTSRRRGTAYFRADARLEKRFRLGPQSYWGLVGEVLNATSTREVVRLDCGERCRERVAGPVILPSVGVEAGF